MESSNIFSTDKATIVIQVNPQISVSDEGLETRGSHHNVALKGFFKSQKALGSVQIMIGVTVCLFGIIRTTTENYTDYSVIIAITYWGSLVYISAGSLSVAVQNKLRPQVVKAFLIMNVFSTITAMVAIILMSIEFGSKFKDCYGYRCSHFKRYDLEVLGMLLLFSILQFVVSICLSRFAYKANYNPNSAVVKY